MNRTGLDALWAGLFAAVITFVVTPLSARLALRRDAVDHPRGRGLSERPTPLLGGLAIFAGAGAATALWLLGGHKEGTAILCGMPIIPAVGAIDDIVELPAPVKLAGQIGAVLPPVLTGVRVDHFTLPFVHRVDLGGAGEALTIVG